MKLDMGITDGRVRAFIVAPVLLAPAWLTGSGSIGGIISLTLTLAVVMVGTAAVDSCPLYLPLHINTDHHADSAC